MITRELVKAWGCCYSDEELEALIPEGHYCLLRNDHTDMVNEIEALREIFGLARERKRDALREQLNKAADFTRRLLKENHKLKEERKQIRAMALGERASRYEAIAKLGHYEPAWHWEQAKRFRELEARTVAVDSELIDGTTPGDEAFKTWYDDEAVTFLELKEQWEGEEAPEEWALKELVRRRFISKNKKHKTWHVTDAGREAGLREREDG